MFGSLRIDRHRLSEDQQKLYRASFCASCHAHHELGGRTSSLLTNYDQTVLTCVAASLGTEEPEPLACTAAPWRAVYVQPLNATTRDYLAAANTLAITAKLRDDQQDEGRLRSTIGLRLLRRQEVAAAERLHHIGFPVSIFDDLPAAQTEVEDDLAPSIESLSQPSRALGGQMFAFLAITTERPELAPTLRKLGEALTTWLYLWDAVIDLEPDHKHGRFNAIAAVHGWDQALEQKHELRQDIELRLHHELEQMESASEQLTGPQVSVLTALLASLRAKVKKRFCTADHKPKSIDNSRLSEAGVCDCPVADCGSCCECGRCGECGCCGDSSEAALSTGCNLAELCHCCPCPGSRPKKFKRRVDRSQLKQAAREFDPAPLVGRWGEATTRIDRRGRVAIDSVEYEASSLDATIPDGAPIYVESYEQLNPCTVLLVRDGREGVRS